MRRQLAELGRIESIRARDEILSRPHYRDGRRLAAAGFKAYSQGDEDGIIAEIFRRIGTVHETFIEPRGAASWIGPLALPGGRRSCRSRRTTPPVL